MRDDTKVVIKYALFIIINCHIYVNHIMLFRSFYLKKKNDKILLYTTK